MRYEAARESLERAIALRPGHPGAYYLRANALYSLERFEAAVAGYDAAIARQPDDARAHHNRGNALFMLDRHESAIASYAKAIALDPNMVSSPAERLHARMHIADWRDFGPELASLTARIGRGEAASNPFAVLALCGSAALQMQAARNWVREKCPPSNALGALPMPGALPTAGAPLARGRRERLRIGYFSADFRNHATAALTAELFETHDRSKFELSVLYLLGGSGSLESNLRREAHARGVAPDRIVFGARLSAPEYLARYRTADLFLDTLPYNAGTTASDALWAGLPVLTCMGETFASRVGASLLRAALVRHRTVRQAFGSRICANA